MDVIGLASIHKKNKTIMELVKFDCTKTVAQATASTRDNYTLYFPTDEQSIYFKGKRVGGDSVASCYGAGYIYYVAKSRNLNDTRQYKYWADTEAANLPPSELISNAAEYGDIDINVHMFTMSKPSNAFNQVCEIVWPNGTASSNADIQPTYERWERIKVGNTWYDWKKVQSSNKGELEIDVYIEADGEGFTNIAEVVECGTDWIYKISSDEQRKIFDFVKNGGTDITFNVSCGSFSGEGRKKASYVAYYSDSNDGMEHVVVGIPTNGMNGNEFHIEKLNITGFA